MNQSTTTPSHIGQNYIQLLQYYPADTKYALKPIK